MICDHPAIKVDRKGTAETVSRLMLWVVSAADFSDRTLTPPLASPALFVRGCAVLKSSDPDCLKSGAESEKRGNVHPTVFILTSLRCLLSEENLNTSAEMPLNSPGVSKTLQTF